MAGKTKTNTTKKVTTKKQPVKRATVYQRPSKAAAFSDYFRFGDSYTSLILGIVVVVIAAILLISFVKGQNITNSDAEQQTSSLSTEKVGDSNTYTVQAGDDLWNIAEEEYGDGFQWGKIAEANNIQNPEMLETGTKLTIPQVEKDSEELAMQASPSAQEEVVVIATPTATLAPTKAPESQTEPTKTQFYGDSYTVQEGDSLWYISMLAYGDPYRYMEIAESNNIQNPDMILVGTKLTITNR